MSDMLLDLLQGFVLVYEGDEKRYKAARLLPGNEYTARVKVCALISQIVWVPCFNLP